jgi:hypothetical protein
MFKEHCNAMAIKTHSSQLPQHSRFQKYISIALNNTFNLFVSFLKDADLISDETIATDLFLAVAKIQFPVKTNFMVRELVCKSERKHETKRKILLKKKEDTKSS